MKTKQKKLKGGDDEAASGIGIEGHGASQEVFITENNRSLVVADRSPRSKAHMMVVPKKHATELKNLEPKDWNSFLPLMKETIRKIDRVLLPVGYNLHVYNGTESPKIQSIPHLHFHIIPAFRIAYGHNWLATRLLRKVGSKEGLEPTSQEYQEAKEKLEIRPGVVSEMDKVIACLEDKEKAVSAGHIIIRPKVPIPSDINAIDAETWDELGRLLKRCFQIIKEKIDVKTFTFHIPLGKMTGPRQENISQFELHLVPIKVEKLVYADSLRYGSVREYKRIGERVRDADRFPPKKPKIAEREREENPFDSNPALI